MRDQVAHHLERARIAARLTIIGTVTEVAPAIEALRRTMEKIHRSRNIAIEVDANPQARFRGERQDLEEMAGNLVDNACKWAASRVFVEVLVERPVEPGAGPTLRIIVDDDGRGLSEAERAQVSRRVSGWTSPSQRFRAGAVDRDRPGGPVWRRSYAESAAHRSADCGPEPGAAGGIKRCWVYPATSHVADTGKPLTGKPRTGRSPTGKSR